MGTRTARKGGYVKTFNRIAEWVESDAGVILLAGGAVALLLVKLHRVGVLS